MVVGGELDVAVLVERHSNERPYRISSGLAGLVVLGMPSLDDAKSSTLSLIPVSYTHLTLPTKRIV